MAIDASQLTDYSWCQIAQAAKVAMINTALGGREIMINGRTIARCTIAEAKELYELALEMIAIEQGGKYGTNVLARFGDSDNGHRREAH
jgi:hypothetical protein